MPDDFGVFAPMFESFHGYFALLHCSSEESTAAVRLANQCASADVDRSAILALLGECNWRPTLVAAVAAVFLPPDARIIAALWHRFDSGSWVTPQLAVVLSMIDPDYQTEARKRLQAQCPLDISELRSLSMAERHSAEGPEGGAARSAKAVSALQYVVSSLAPPPEWFAAVLASPEHQALVSSDLDSGGRIAQRWSMGLNHIRQQLACAP